MEKLILVIGVLAFVVLVSFAMAFPFMWIWNFAIVKAISIANIITYWPAYWMMLFINIWVGTSVSQNS